MAKPILIIRHFNENELKQLRKVLIESGVSEQYFIITFVCSAIPNDYEEYPKFEVHGLEKQKTVLAAEDDFRYKDSSRVINPFSAESIKEPILEYQNLRRKDFGFDPI